MEEGNSHTNREKEGHKFAMNFTEDQRLEQGTIVQAQGPSEAKGPQVKVAQICELISCDGYQPHFQYLAKNSFENKRQIKALGMAKWKKGEVSEEALSLGNRFYPQIDAAYLPKVSVRWISESIGHGLFTEIDIKKNGYVGEYTGHVRKNNQRYFQPLNNYCYEYPVPDESGRNYVIDATCGNFTRFINHSNQPNLRPIHAFHQGFYHLIFLALHPIPAGKQLSYDYGANYWYVRNPPHPL